MRTLIQIAADLAKLPNDDTPEFVYQRCKQIAVELRDYYDATKGQASYSRARQRFMNDVVFNGLVTGIRRGISEEAFTISDAKEAIVLIECETAVPRLTTQ